MKHISFGFLFILLSYFSNSQIVLTDSVNQETVIAQGNIMAKLLVNKDYKAFVKWLNPAIISMTGSEEKLIELTKQSITKMADDSLFITNLYISSPSSIIHFNEQLQCTVIQTIEMKFPKGRVVSSSPLIAISINQGKNWTFIDPHGEDLKTLQKTVLNLSNDLIIPEQQKPVIYKN